MLAGFGVLGVLLWLWPWIGEWKPSVLAWAATGRQITALCLCVVGVLLFLLSHAPLGFAGPVYVAWMSVVVPIGVFMSTLMLAVLFILLLPVFSLIVRMGDPLRKKLTTQESYWEDYKHYEPTLERMRRPF